MAMTLPPRHLLSKSTFLYGCQCPKRLWLHKKRPDLRDEEDEAQTAVFQAGTDVGLLARRRFPGGVDASPPDPFSYPQSVADTQRYLQEGVPVIYEAAFQYEGVLAAVDILVQQGDRWIAYEVKSTNSVKEPHKLDAALQYYVLTHAGLALADFCILHLNRGYIRSGALDLRELFTPTSVLEEVRAQQTFVEQKIPQLKRVLQQKTEPAIDPGDHCMKPYACDFYGYCTTGLEEEEPDYGEPFIHREAIRSFVEQLQYPLHFMDFETWATPVPEQDGLWPFRPVPFQFSLHVQPEPGADYAHRHYLAEGPHIHHRSFAERLAEAVGTTGSVLVYNKTFENGILNHLKAEFADLAETIASIQDRIVDLMAPFRKHYRLPAMQGSYSIKSVLPALVPELRYDELAIGNGADASTAFYNLRLLEDSAEVQKTREALLKYCERDTWGMVRILEHLATT
ncbi:MAG TPA: DUF2779 domain-containing protein [Lacibacter sp.]|nr:DUF2779 domain-containing protein [Lacibacter sp.]HMO89850.1 DUF2779 domain-containing protein [Lacibacter sp.]